MTKSKEAAVRQEICDLVDEYKSECMRRDAAVAKLNKKATIERKASEDMEKEIREKFAMLGVSVETEETFHGKTQKLKFGKGKLVTTLASSKRLFNAMDKVGKAWECMKYGVGDLKKELTGADYAKVVKESRDGSIRSLTFPK